MFCVSRSAPELPLQLEDAARSDVALAADPSLPRVNQDVRLNNRIIDLRTPTVLTPRRASGPNAPKYGVLSVGFAGLASVLRPCCIEFALVLRQFALAALRQPATERSPCGHRS